MTFRTTGARALYVLIVALACLVTFFLHEGAHWATGELLGNDMRMTLNQAYPVSREYVEPWHRLYVSAAGPLATLLQGILVSLIALRPVTPFAYPFLLSAVVMRVLAFGVGLIAKPQDEADVSLALDLGQYTLPALMCVALIALAVVVSRRQRYTARFNTISVVLIITFSSAIILTA